MTQQEFLIRRKQLITKMQSHSVALLFAAPQVFRNGNVAFPYRQNSDFYYLTGFSEPNAVAVFIKGASTGEYVLFNQPKVLVKEQWSGLRAGQEKAIDEYEAMRLVDLEEVEQGKAGKQMKISQPTLSRLLSSARRKISEAIVKGKAIRIEGGSCRFR